MRQEQHATAGRKYMQEGLRGTGVGQGVRRCMAPMHPHIVLISVTCVTARPRAVLDVCVLPPRCCASVAVVMLQCGAMRVDALEDVPPVQPW